MIRDKRVHLREKEKGKGIKGNGKHVVGPWADGMLFVLFSCLYLDHDLVTM